MKRSRLVTLSHNLTIRETEMLRHLAQHYNLPTHDKRDSTTRDTKHLWQRAITEKILTKFLRHFENKPRGVAEAAMAKHFPEKTVEMGRKSGTVVRRSKHKEIVALCREVGLYRYQAVALMVRWAHYSTYGWDGSPYSEKREVAQEDSLKHSADAADLTKQARVFVPQENIIERTGTFCVEVSISGSNAKLTVRDNSENDRDIAIQAELASLRKEVQQLTALGHRR